MFLGISALVIPSTDLFVWMYISCDLCVGIHVCGRLMYMWPDGTCTGPCCIRGLNELSVQDIELHLVTQSLITGPRNSLAFSDSLRLVGYRSQIPEMSWFRLVSYNYYMAPLLIGSET